MKRSLLGAVVTLTACGLVFSTTARADFDLGSDDYEIGQDISELGILPDSLPSLKGATQQEPFLQLPMRYPTYAHPAAERMTALAVSDRGRNIVLYGPKAAQKLGNQVMGGIIQHEYCHHDLHHRGQSSAVSEAQADCCAAYNLVQYGTHEALQKVIEFTQGGGCRYDKSTALAQVRESHPCGEQRSYIYKYCSNHNLYQLDEAFIRGKFPLANEQQL